jgi:hypothetical protein
MLPFDHGVPDNRCLEEFGVSEPGHIHTVYAEYMSKMFFR